MDPVNRIFDPIGHETVVDEVVEQFEELILSGVLKEDTKLPPEREMAELFGVSRPKLREAMKRLEEMKLLHIHHGDGSFIAPLIGKALSPALMDLYSRSPMAFYDYLEYRREQECFAARLAAVRATSADREILSRIMQEMERTQQNDDVEGSKKADIAFHSAIVDASHNSTLTHMMSSIYELTKRGVFYNRNYLRTIDGTGEELLRQHLALGQAVLDGKSAEAAEAARIHIDFVEKSFRVGDEIKKRENLANKRLLISEALQSK